MHIHAAFEPWQNLKKEAIDIGIDLAHVGRIYKKYIVGF